MGYAFSEPDKSLPLPQVGTYFKITGRDSAPSLIEVYKVMPKTVDVKFFYRSVGTRQRRGSLNMLQFRLFKSSGAKYEFVPFAAALALASEPT